MAMNPRLLRPKLGGDPDAARYIAAVQLADGEQLELAVRKAITDFVVGCKADGIWTAIKASCILMGARTLSGALTPLVGTAPTNVNFVSGDYNRKTGLVGNGSTKCLNSNRNNNADPQDSKHLAVFVTTAVTGGTISNSGPPATPGRTGIGFTLGDATAQTSINSALPFDPSGNVSNALASNTFMGIVRSVSTEYGVRFNGANSSVAIASTTPNNGNHFFFARNNTTPDLYSSSRLAFYSIGEALTLSSLDSRVTTLYNAIGAAIP